MFLVAANTRQAIVGQKEWLTTGSSGIQVQFLFSDDWDGLSKFAVFRNAEIEESVIPIALPPSNLTELPAENCAAEYVDEKVYVGVYGTDGLGHIIIPTIWVSLGVLKEGAAYEGMDPPQPTPDMWAQILAIAQNAGAENAAAAEAAAGRAEEAAELLTDVSATATTLEPEKQATANYNNGVFEFGIPKGQKGDPLTYEDLTEEQKEELVQGPILDAQDAAVTAVGNARVNAVNAVNQAGTTQVGNVNQAGTTQVQAVADKGAEVIGSIPPDYSDLAAEVDDLNRQLSDVEENQIPELKSALNQVYIPSENLYNPATDRHGININGSGVITEDTSYKASDYIYVGGGNKVTIQVDPKQQRIYFYKTNDESGFSRSLWITGTGSQTFTLSSIENYIVITMLETLPDFMVNIGDTLLPYAPYGGSAGVFLQDTLDGVEAMVNAELENVPKKDIINRFDKSTITSGCYLATSDGTLVNEDSFFASDYIDVSDLENIKCSYTHIVCFYDVQKVFISGQSFNTNNEDNSIQRPENAVYMRFSNYLTKLNDSQIGKDVSRSNYSPYGKYTLPDLIESENIIIVDANGNGDYTSLTQALYDNVNSGVNIKVLPGVYNIVSEYVSIFGQSAVDNMADSDSATFKGFQYGAIIRNRKITFEPGSHIICDWTGHTVDGTHRFSALRVDYNCELIGLDLVATGTFYAIHDDYGLDDIPYTVKYENCRVEGVNLTNANCIGGGCQKYSKHILKNCYFNNNLTNSATVRYHNTNAEGAEPEIYVSNCYFNNWFTPRWYGAQTSKMRVYVNNCHARAIYKIAESSSYDVDNVELYKWNNEETDPRT